MRISEIKEEKFNLKKLPHEKLPYFDGKELVLEENLPLDKDGIFLFEKDGKKYYHPVLILEAVFYFLRSYFKTKDKKMARKSGKIY